MVMMMGAALVFCKGIALVLIAHLALSRQLTTWRAAGCARGRHNGHPSHAHWLEVLVEESQGQRAKRIRAGHGTQVRKAL